MPPGFQIGAVEAIAGSGAAYFSIIPGAFLVALGFTYTRVRGGGRIDLGTGLSAYCAVLIGVSALVIATGLGTGLASIVGKLDQSFVYGDGEPDFRGDAASGLALTIAAGLVLLVHLGLRWRLLATGHHDGGAERTVEVVVLLALALTAAMVLIDALQLLAVGWAIDGISDAAGRKLCWAATTAAVWAVYVWRIFVSPPPASAANPSS